METQGNDWREVEGWNLPSESHLGTSGPLPWSLVTPICGLHSRDGG